MLWATLSSNRHPLVTPGTSTFQQVSEMVTSAGVKLAGGDLLEGAGKGMTK